MSGESLRCAWCGTGILHAEQAVSQTHVVAMSDDQVELEETGRVWCSEEHARRSEQAARQKREQVERLAQQQPDRVIQDLAGQIRDRAHLNEIIGLVEGGKDMREAVREQLRPYLSFALEDETVQR